MKAIWRSIVNDVTFHPRSSQVLAIANRKAYVFSGELEPRKPVPNDVLEVNFDSNGKLTSYIKYKMRCFSGSIALDMLGISL